MSHLIFFKNGESLFKYPIKKERLSIGREPTNDIVLADDAVSRLHCEIFKKDSGLVLKDSSVNGTFLNSRRVFETKFTENDEVKIGDWAVRFKKDGAGEEESTAACDNEETKIIAYDSANKILVSESIDFKITPPDGNKIYKRLKRCRYTIGSGDTNNLIIDDEYVSKKHCRIYFEGKDLFLVDLGSTNGTFLEGERVEKAVLPASANITIGKTEISLKRVRESEKITPAEEIRIGGMIGASDAIKEIFSLVSKVAPTDATVFITGESGTGKELVARSVHDLSSRPRGPFVALNCGAIPPSIIESELFGHEKGAFTGASQPHKGVFEQADGGTLFLDEIGEMPIDLQTRLLRVLETKTIKRIGGQRDINVDVRIVAATNQDVKQQVLSGKFREDLFFRLFIIPVHIPPLRERRPDIPVLASHFTKLFSLDEGEVTIGEKAMEKLISHSWIGNVRELRNTIQRAVIMNKGGSINSGDIILTELRDPSDPRSMPLMSQEKEAVIDALRRSGGNQSKAAQLLGIARTTLALKVRKYEIDLSLMKL